MNLSNIISLVRNQTGASTNTIPDLQILDYVNLVYHDIETAINQSNQNYFHETFITDLITDQSEYLLPNIKKILSISAKYEQNRDYLIKLREADFDSLQNDISYYQQYQSALDPFYILGDDTLFICPSPNQNIDGGLNIRGIVPLDDLSLDAIESDIKIDKNYHGVLIMGIKVYVYGALGMAAEKRDAKNDYEQAKQEMLNDLVQRVEGSIEGVMIDLSSLL